eukprot:TRINITY_DN17264_c0_g1_i2.p2 TRINITY_DN17264_c0_g1~~TRINITY_DN17264_c0_g1_i2.p2  ORF type:complete len:156 (+),score=22.51 TRINITY_DN17264_c0_g1_i2:38-505(+)
MYFGRVHCIIITNRSGQVIYERFYERLNELDKARARAACARVLEENQSAQQVEDQVFISGYKGCTVGAFVQPEFIIFGIGSGEVHELLISKVLRIIVEGFKLTMKLSKPPTELILWEKYVKLCITIDEVINEGMLENTNPEDIKKAYKMKVPGEA